MGRAPSMSPRGRVPKVAYGSSGVQGLLSGPVARTGVWVTLQGLAIRTQAAATKGLPPGSVSQSASSFTTSWCGCSSRSASTTPSLPFPSTAAVAFGACQGRDGSPNWPSGALAVEGSSCAVLTPPLYIRADVQDPIVQGFITRLP